MISARAHFDSQLRNLRDQLLRMGSLADEALDGAMRALLERDSELATRVIRGDETINQLRYAIEEQSYLLLATQQPMAGDLRQIAAAISIATNMERMADHATGIAVLARRLNNEPEVKPPTDILRMVEVTRTMLRRALDAYLTTDVALAREVAAEDEQINQLHEQVLRELIGDMLEDPRSTRRNTYLLWVAHNLERWGDRIKNICERVVYMATGELTEFDAYAGAEGELDEHDGLADPLDNLE